MKKRTLNQTWTLCLRMWRHIAKVWGESEWDVLTLKNDWLRANGLATNLSSGIYNSCFFCDYNKGAGQLACGGCPGVLVDSSFV